MQVHKLIVDVVHARGLANSKRLLTTPHASAPYAIVTFQGSVQAQRGERCVVEVYVGLVDRQRSCVRLRAY